MRKNNLTKTVLALTMALSLGAMTGCSSGAQAETTEATTTAATEVVEETKSQEFVLEYPAHMQSLGFTENVVLESYPETIVTLSTYPVLTLFEMDVKLAAAPSTKVIEYPADFDGVILPGMMSEQFDIETVVAMEPDLVICPSSVMETYAETFSSVGIPVYYVAMTSSETDVYTLIKEQTEALVNAFSVDEESAKKGEAVMAKFDGTEEKFASVAKLVEGKSVLAITVSGGDTIYLNTESSTLGCMLKLCGFENVANSGEATTGHSMNQLDMEQALAYTPDYIFITGSGTLEENTAVMEAIYNSNPEYWDSIEAYKNGNVFLLPSSYVSTAGINILNNIDNLIDMVETKVNGN